MNTIHKVMNKRSEIKSFGTKIPICPWCGAEYYNYEAFSCKDIVVLCCREDTDKKFKVIRVTSKNDTIYNTVKLKY
jgi:hypothetical protein